VSQQKLKSSVYDLNNTERLYFFRKRDGSVQYFLRGIEKPLCLVAGRDSRRYDTELRDELGLCCCRAPFLLNLCRKLPALSALVTQRCATCFPRRRQWCRGSERCQRDRSGRGYRTNSIVLVLSTKLSGQKKVLEGRLSQLNRRSRVEQFIKPHGRRPDPIDLQISSYVRTGGKAPGSVACSSATTSSSTR
jgi:hypothetical protein